MNAFASIRKSLWLGIAVALFTQAASPTGESCGSVSKYCPATPNSTGMPAEIGVTGSLSISANDTYLHAFNLPASRFGHFIWGFKKTNLPFGNGRLCVSPFTPGLHTIGSPAQTGLDGEAVRFLDFTQPGAGYILPGDTWYFQYWFRDPGGGGLRFNLSDAVAVEFCQ